MLKKFRSYQKCSFSYLVKVDDGSVRLRYDKKEAVAARVKQSLSLSLDSYCQHFKLHHVCFTVNLLMLV